MTAMTAKVWDGLCDAIEALLTGCTPPLDDPTAPLEDRREPAH